MSAPVPRLFSAGGGPSEAAVDAALKRVHYAPAHAEKALDAAHDPRLGVERSVSLREVLAFLRLVDWQQDTAADALEAEFGSGGSQ